jgi:hypothetical protein
VVEVKGLAGATILAHEELDVPSATTKAFPIRVRVPAGHAEPGSNKIAFVVHDRDDASVTVTEKAVFLAPR